MRTTRCFLACVLVAACAADAEKETAPDVEAFRAEVLGDIAASVCPADPCPLVPFMPTPAAAREESRGRRILLVDDAIVLPAATRWPDRVLGVLAQGPDGTYAEATPTFTMAQDALDVLAKVAAFPRPVSAETLDLAAAFFAKFSTTIPGDAYGHGGDILPFLAERIPGSQFLLSEDQLDAPAGCELLDADPGDASWAAHDAFVARMSSSLETAIVRYGINTVHLSWGLDHVALSRSFESQCGRPASVAVTRRFMEPYVTLFRDLTALETPSVGGRLDPVLVFQAGASGTDPDEQFLDCADLPRRLRVYSVPYVGTAVPPEGSHDYSLLSRPLAELGCNDVFVVMGYTSIFEPTRGDRYFPSMPFGLGRAPRPSWPPASSFANPVGLAHFLRLAGDHPEERPADWIGRFTAGGTRPIIDPLLYEASDVRTGSLHVPDMNRTSP